MKNCLFAFTLVSNLIFFAIIPIIGINFSSSADTPLFKIFCVLLSGTSMLILIWELFIKKRFSGTIIDYFFLLIPLIISGIILFEQPEKAFPYEIFKRFIIWSLPAILMGLYYSRNVKKLQKSLKYWYLIMLIMTFGSLINIYDSLVSMNITEILGERYQTISYTASLAYAINLLFLLFYSQIKDLIRIKYFRLIAAICLLIQAITVVASGGRGGFVVIIVSTLFYVYLSTKYFGFSKKKIGVIAAVICGFLLVSIPLLIESNPIVERGLERVISYIGSDGIDMSETSNRDKVYLTSIERAKEQPLFGYGIYKQMDLNGYPHNILLEVMLGGGLIYLSVFLLLSYVFLRRFLWFLCNKKLPLILLPLFLYAFVMLMFSGTYLEVSLFWFVGTYVMCVNDNEKNNPDNNNISAA